MSAVYAIPPMLDPLGRYWLQPKREEIEVDATHAVMSRSAFAKLSDYSRSQPSGVYSGKMWKRLAERSQHLPCGEAVEAGAWLLCWYGLPYPEGHQYHGSVKNEYRIILLVD